MRLKTAKPLDPAYPIELKTIGDHIRKRRLDLRLRQRDVAAQLGIDVDTIRNWEVGRAKPNLRAMPAVLRFLGYDPRATVSDLGQRLRWARQTRGMSIDELAKELRVDPSTLRNWEVSLHHPPVQYYPRIYGVTGPDPLPEESTLADRIRAYRRLHGLTQAELGRVLGISGGSISDWECGRCRPASTVRWRLEEMVAS